MSEKNIGEVWVDVNPVDEIGEPDWKVAAKKWEARSKKYREEREELQNTKAPKHISEIVINHQEKTVSVDGYKIPYFDEDGRGPSIAGIQNADGYITVNIPIIAKAASVVAKKAPYKGGLSHEELLKVILSQSRNV